MFVLRPYRFDATTPPIVVPNGLIAFYKLDESTGDAVDEINAYNGTVVGPTQGITGVIDNAYSFDGINDYINVDSLLPAIETNQGSLSLWVKTTDDDAGAIFTATQGSISLKFLQIYLGDGVSGTLTNELITIAVFGGTSSTILGYTTTNRNELFDGSWHHIVLTSNGSTYKLYLDGIEKTITIGNVGSYENNGDWFGDIANLDSVRIANRKINGAESGFFNGSIDHVKIYNRALSAAEVTELYAEYPIVVPDGLIAFYKLDESTGDAVDEINAYNGTVVGATQGVTGIIDNAYSFDGVNDYVEVDDLTSGVASNQEGSISVWVNVNDAGGQNSIIWIGQNADKLDRIWFFIGNYGGNDGTVRALMGEVNNRWSYYTDNQVVSSNTWHHIVLTQNGTAPKIYVDGSEVSISSISANSPGEWFGDMSVIDTARIGYNVRVNGWYLDGKMDNLRIYDRAISAAEVTSLYNEGI